MGTSAGLHTLHLFLKHIPTFDIHNGRRYEQQAPHPTRRLQLPCTYRTSKGRSALLGVLATPRELRLHRCWCSFGVCWNPDIRMESDDVPLKATNQKMALR